MKQPYLLLRIILGITGLSQMVIGLIGLIPAIPVSIVLMFYGATTLQINPQVTHILQMFGVYMASVGLLCFFAVWDPVKNKSIIYGISLLLVVRFIQRITFAGQAYEVFGISPAYYWVQTIVFLATAVALILLRPKASDPAKA